MKLPQVRSRCLRSRWPLALRARPLGRGPCPALAWARLAWLLLTVSCRHIRVLCGKSCGWGRRGCVWNACLEFFLFCFEKEGQPSMLLPVWALGRLPVLGLRPQQHSPEAPSSPSGPAARPLHSLSLLVWRTCWSAGWPPGLSQPPSSSLHCPPPAHLMISTCCCEKKGPVPAPRPEQSDLGAAAQVAV